MYSGMVTPDGYLSAPEVNVLKGLCSVTSSSLSWVCCSNFKAHGQGRDLDTFTERMCHKHDNCLAIEFISAVSHQALLDTKNGMPIEFINN